MNAVPQTVDAETQAPVAASIPQSLMGMFDRVLTDTQMPLERVEFVMGKIEEWQNREAEQSFNRSFAAAQAEMLPVVKDETNTHTRSKYATLEAIDRAIKPIIAKHGFALSFYPFNSDQPNCQGVRVKVMHRDGHSEVEEAHVPIDKAGAQGKVNKTDTQAYGSTTRYGQRYLKLMIFDIATGEGDDDGNGGADLQTISDAEYRTLLEGVEQTGMDLTKLEKHLGVETLAELPVASLNLARHFIAQKTQQASNG
ncbi:MAG: ERF family protein [Hyphomicrobiales bacterium]